MGHDWIEKKWWQVEVERKQMGQGAKGPVMTMRRFKLEQQTEGTER